MSRRVLIPAACVIPTIGIALFAGCSAEPLPQDLCHWLDDPNSCYATFSADVKAHCGTAIAQPVDANVEVLNETSGAFGARDTLDICVLNAGGTIIFDPPLDITTFPPTSVAFTITDQQGVSCGSGSYGGEFNYSLTVEKIDLKEDGCDDNWTGGEAKLADDITGGTFAVTQGEDRAAFDVSCPNGGDSFRFSTYNVSDAVVNDSGDLAPGACPSCAPLLPRAEFVSSPGVASLVSANSKAGYVRLRVYYPATSETSAAPTTLTDCPSASATSSSSSGTTPADGASDLNKAQCENPKNFIVEYFSCSIPAPPSPCEDGAKNNDETDIDCGGSTCAARCAAGLACKDASDCQSGSCALNAGVKQCS